MVSKEEIHQSQHQGLMTYIKTLNNPQDLKCFMEI